MTCSQALASLKYVKAFFKEFDGDEDVFAEPLKKMEDIMQVMYDLHQNKELLARYETLEADRRRLKENADSHVKTFKRFLQEVYVKEMNDIHNKKEEHKYKDLPELEDQ